MGGCEAETWRDREVERRWRGEEIERWRGRLVER